MPIYVTPFTNEPRECTGESVDSGFTSLDEVRAAMGEGYVRASSGCIIYGDDNDRVIFAPVVFRIYRPVNND